MQSWFLLIIYKIYAIIILILHISLLRQPTLKYLSHLWDYILSNVVVSFIYFVYEKPRLFVSD